MNGNFLPFIANKAGCKSAGRVIGYATRCPPDKVSTAWFRINSEIYGQGNSSKLTIHTS